MQLILEDVYLVVEVVLDQDELVEILLQPFVYLCLFDELVFQIPDVVFLVYYFLTFDGQLRFEAVVILGVLSS